MTMSAPTPELGPFSQPAAFAGPKESPICSNLRLRPPNLYGGESRRFSNLGVLLLKWYRFAFCLLHQSRMD